MFAQASSHGIGGDPLKWGYAGTLTAGPVLPVSRKGSIWMVDGNATISRLTPMPNGHTVELHFSGTPTLTHSSLLQMPGAANVTVDAGSAARFVSLGNGVWRCHAMFANFIRAIAGTTDSSIARSAIAAAPFDAMAYSGLQMNGLMEVCQENGFTGKTLTATGSLQFAHILDGVVAGYRGSFVATAKQDWAPFVNGMPAIYACKVSVTTAQASLGTNDELTLMMPIEGVRWTNPLLFSTNLAKPVSLGFWIMANRPGTYSGALMNKAKTKSYSFSFNIATANVAQWVSLSGATAIPGETTNSIWEIGNLVGAYLCICLAGGTSRVGTPGAWTTTTSPGMIGATGTTNGVAATSDVFYISNVIMLPGRELPTGDQVPFALRKYVQELPLCQRYFYNGEPLGRGVVLGTNSLNRMSARHPVQMRAVPTLNMAAVLSAYDGTAYGPASSINNNFCSTDFFEVDLFMNLSLVASAANYTVGRPACIYMTGTGNMEVDARLTG